MTCPLRTMELKSAYRFCTVPDTCVPTCTVVSASSVPVAPTASTMSPRVMVPLTISGASSPPRYLAYPQTLAPMTPAAAMMSISFFCMGNQACPASGAGARWRSPAHPSSNNV